MTIKTHKFNKVKYAIDTDKCDAICEPPANSLPTIFFPLGIDRTKASLERVLHEAIHACDFDMPENKVDMIAKDMANFLWRLGYRLK